MNRFLLAALMLSFSVGSLIAQEAPTESVPTFKAGARVRAQISAPNVDETEWFRGTVTSSVEGCGLLVMNDVPSQYVARDGTVLVTFQSIVALQLSSLYDGHIDPETFRQRNYTPDKSLEGEEWVDVPVDSLKAADPVKCRER
jgi:hypothetical protein